MTTAPQSWPCAADTCDRELCERELTTGQRICDPCVRQMTAWLAELPNQLVVLEASTQREVRGAGGRSGTRTPPLPGREDTLNLTGPGATQVVHGEGDDQHGETPLIVTLGGWTRVVVEERHLHGPCQWTVPGCAVWLIPHLGWVAMQGWAGDIRDELYDMIRAVRGITQVRPRSRPIPQPCPRCDALTLVETDWETYIHCGGCEARFTRSELALAARIAMAS